jgi:hypothetical protein
MNGDRGGNEWLMRKEGIDISEEEKVREIIIIRWWCFVCDR